jgi:hypothetical protein
LSFTLGPITLNLSISHCGSRCRLFLIILPLWDLVVYSQYCADTVRS